MSTELEQMKARAEAAEARNAQLTEDANHMRREMGEELARVREQWRFLAEKYDAMDARLRAVTEALKAYRKAFQDGPENCTYSAYEEVDMLAASALALARSGDLPETIDRLTLDKIASVKARGYVQTGAVLLSPNGKESCIVDRAAVRWLSETEWWTVMHPPCSVEAQTLTYAKSGDLPPHPDTERLKEAKALLAFIDSVAPRSDSTCVEPGITFTEACRRQMREDAARAQAGKEAQP